MAVVRERLGGDLLENVIIDPQSVKTFDVPRALLRFTDAAPISLSPVRGLRDIGPYDTKTSDDYLRRRFDRCEVICAYPKGRTAILRDLDKLTSYLRNGYNGTSDKDPDFPPFDKTFRLDSAVFSAVLSGRRKGFDSLGQQPDVLPVVEKANDSDNCHYRASNRRY